MSKRLSGITTFTATMSAMYLINLATIGHPGIAFVTLLALVVGGAMMLSELLAKRKNR